MAVCHDSLRFSRQLELPCHVSLTYPAPTRGTLATVTHTHTHTQLPRSHGARGIANTDEEEPEPDDVDPDREPEGGEEEAGLDSEDDPEEGDELAPKVAPTGFRIVDTPSQEEQLAFSKEASPADELVARSLLYNWPVAGWLVLT